MEDIMGYDCKIYLVNKTDVSLESDDGLVFSEVIAMFDLCKMDYNGAYHKLVKEAKPTNCYIYADDGDTKITTDNYGDKLKELPFLELLAALKKDNTGYRRVMPLIAMLAMFKIEKDKWPDLTILHYGH